MRPGEATNGIGIPESFARGKRFFFVILFFFVLYIFLIFFYSSPDSGQLHDKIRETRKKEEKYSEGLVVFPKFYSAVPDEKGETARRNGLSTTLNVSYVRLLFFIRLNS